MSSSCSAATSSSSSAATASRGSFPLPPPYACATIGGDETDPAGPGAAGGATATRRWIVDLRPATEFGKARFALTRHLPPDEAIRPEAREACRAELREICDEAAFAVALLTSGDALTPRGCSGLHPSLVAEIAEEFLADGFANVAIVRGGYAALSPELRAGMLVSDDVAPDFSDPAPLDRLAGARAAAERARQDVHRAQQKAGEAVKGAGEAVKKVFSFARRSKAVARNSNSSS